MPQLAVQVSPGAKVISPSPELNAFEGQVIGSTAMPVWRAFSPGNESPVKTYA